MRSDEARAWLHDALRACEAIARFTSGKALGDYLRDELLRSAVERKFEIVGEALGRARRADTRLVEAIEHAERIISFRHRLIHGYASVADEVVWGVVETSLPSLTARLTGILSPQG